MPTATRLDVEGLTARCQALSDPKRIAVLELLQDGELCVCDIQEALDMPQSLLSFHLKVLRDHRFVTARRRGRWAYYGLKTEGFRDVIGAVGALGIRR